MEGKIDIYGRAQPDKENKWEEYPNYRGVSRNKINTLLNYNFNLCFENCDRDGYITEKIIHSMMGGCVPLYWGGGRFLEQTIPSSCFINCKDQDPAEIYRRISGMSHEEIIAYRQAGIDFLSSVQADRFKWGHWAGLVCQRLLETSQHRSHENGW